MTQEVPSGKSRRQFLRDVAGWASLATIAGVTGYAWRWEPHWVEFVRRDLTIARLPEHLDGKTLVQLSDLHVGPLVDDDYLIDSFRQVAAINPDILVLTGDFMTCGGAEEIDHTLRVLEHIRPARLATLGILGNHDYGCNWRDSRVGDQLCVGLDNLGIQMLRNSCHEVRGLQVAGLDDLWGPNWEPKKALAGLRPDRAQLVLCHNPDGADFPGWKGYQGWILSGHTHGGQCKSPFLNPPRLPVKNRRYIAGAYDLFDGRQLYINRALGYSIRVRFNVRPEVTIFTLRSSADHFV